LIKRHRFVGVMLALTAVVAACGGDDDSGSGTDDTAESPGTETADTGGAGETGEATGAEPTAAPADGATITIALGSEPTSLDPHIVDDGGERAINDNIYETLLTRDAQGELGPGLAVDLPTQVDDTTWEFKLREGVTFHDGTPFNADAVVSSVDRMIRFISEEVTDNSGFYSTLAGATKVDDYTVQIQTTGPDGVLPARMYWLKITAPGTESIDDLSDAPNGTGPYTFVGRETGVSIDLAANPDYWGGAPSIAAVHYEFVTEAGTRLAGLKSGRYDLISNLAPNTVQEAPAYAAQQGQEHPVIILDADDGITADVNVRKALNLAIDKQALADAIYNGFAVVDEGQVLSPSILGYNDELSAYPYDPDEAARLIEEAGVAGQTITLVGESSGRWLNDRDLVEAIAGYWTAAGLVVDLQTPEFGAYLDILFDRSNRADAIFVSSSNDILDPDRQLSTYYQAGGIGSSNSDAELSALIDAGRSELDADARAAIYRDAVQLAYDQAYFAWLVSNQDLYGLSERLEFTPRVDSKLLVKDMSVSG
jgi:peptide/nickel transport system substrate-binding protein